MKILVTGGAGYIGSVVAAALNNAGHKLTIIDDLRQGHRRALPDGSRLLIVDICDKAALDNAFAAEQFEAVIHLAGESAIQYSTADPGRFFHSNVAGGINLLDAMRKYGVLNIIFSSSAAVYGEPQSTPITESHPKNPVNSYGESKLIFEKVLHWYGGAYGIKHISLRYFNAAGAHGRLGEDHRPETHLIPNILRSALKKDGTPVNLFGRDYPTADGTCLRDYVHVSDIAQAHILALHKLLSSNPESSIPEPCHRCGTPHDVKESGLIYNLGSSGGYSVLQVIQAARKVTGVDIPLEIAPRRSGDPAFLNASWIKAKQELGWQPRFTRLEEIIESAWQWMKDNPEGYEE